MTEGEPLLSAREVTVKYGSVVAVDGADFEVYQGEAVGLLGANGAGKTSTLRALCRQIRSTGRVTFAGADITQWTADGAARAGLVHVPEGRRLFGSLTAEENLLVGMTARGRRKQAFGLKDIYKLFPALTELRGRSAWTLSGGEQQMVAIGRGLLAAPRLLLLDEPSLGLAPVMVDAVYGALREVRDMISLVIVEQNATLALSVCNRAYVLSVGAVAMSGPAEALADRENLLASYLAR